MTVASFVNLCQPGVNLCQVLVTVGKRVVAGGGVGCLTAMLRGERHGSALLFYCERSRSWGKWGVWWATVGVVGRAWG